MKIPLSWLKDYVDLTLPPAALAERLTLAGMEVESITRSANSGIGTRSSSGKSWR